MSDSARLKALGESVVKAAAPPASVALIVILGWSLFADTIYAGKAYLFPGPGAVLSALAANRAVIVSALLITLREASVGYGSAIVLGVAAAAVLSQSRLLERSLYPYAILLQTVPIVAVAPLIVLWFGYDEKSVMIVSAMVALFPIINNTLFGLLSTPRTLVELFDMHKTGRLRCFFKLRLPSALPSIMAGLRISAGLSVIGAIIGEFIIGSGNNQGGMGVQIIFAQGRMFTSLLFAEVIAATLLGFVFFSTVNLLSRLLLRHWHESAAR